MPWKETSATGPEHSGCRSFLAVCIQSIPRGHLALRLLDGVDESCHDCPDLSFFGCLFSNRLNFKKRMRYTLHVCGMNGI